MFAPQMPPMGPQPMQQNPMWSGLAGIAYNPLFMGGLQGFAAASSGGDWGGAMGRGMQGAQQQMAGAQQLQMQQQQLTMQQQQHALQREAMRRKLEREAAMRKAFTDPSLRESLGPYADVVSLSPELMQTVLQEKLKPAPSPFAKINPSEYTPESVQAFMRTGNHGVLQKLPTPRNRPTAQDRYGRLIYTDTGEPVVKGADPNDIPLDSTGAFKLRDRGLTELAPYREQFESYARVMRALEKDSGAADVASIVGFTKFLDPGSVAREGEVALAQSSMGAMNQIGAIISKFKEQGGLLTPEAKDQIRQAMGTIMQDVRRHYGIRRGKLTEFGNALNLRPETTLPAELPWDTLPTYQPPSAMTEEQRTQVPRLRPTARGFLEQAAGK